MNLKAGAVGLLVCSVVLSEGCNKNQATFVTFGQVFGKVTLTRQPVTGGRLRFLSKEGLEHTVKIESDGTYRGTLPIGDMQVGVDTEFIKAGSQDPGIGRTNAFVKAMSKYKDGKTFQAKDFPKEGSLPSNLEGMKYVQIPEKYRNPRQSGLSVTVKEGEPQEKNFDLP
jgi:hypothetical protein